MPKKSRNQWDKDTDGNKVELSCRIRQEHFKLGAEYIAEVHSPRVICEVLKFKQKAFMGAAYLGHEEYAKSIEAQMAMLDKALEVEKL